MAPSTPGTTLKTIVDEYELLRDVKRVLMERLELDLKYGKDLLKIRDSINPKHADSALSSLIAPLVKFFDDEIYQRGTICDTIKTKIASLPYPSANEPDEKGIVPSSLYKALKVPYEDARKHEEIAGSGHSVAEMQKWWKRRKETEFKLYLAPEEVEDYKIPEDDRNYRASVVRQHQVVTKASSWHTKSLPNRLEHHKACIETTKKTIEDVINDTSLLHSNVVQDCSLALQSVDGFSCSQFIENKRNMASEEISSPLLQPVVYRNFWLRGKDSSPPVFASSREKFEELVGCLLNSHSDEAWAFSGRFISTGVAIESKPPQEEISSLVKEMTDEERGDSLALALLNHPPLLPLDEKLVLQFTAGIPRKRIGALLPPDKTSRQLLQKILHAKIKSSRLAVLLTHRVDATEVVKDIGSKWDFSRNCPYPEGVTRVDSVRKPLANLNHS